MVNHLFIFIGIYDIIPCPLFIGTIFPHTIQYKYFMALRQNLWVKLGLCPRPRGFFKA